MKGLEHKDYVWSYDFVPERASDGRAFRILTILDKYTEDGIIMPSDTRKM